MKKKAVSLLVAATCVNLVFLSGCVYPKPKRIIHNDQEVKGKIIFESNRTGLNDLYSVLPNGNNLINLTRTANEHEVSPTWSSDGKSIIYIADPVTTPGSTYGWDMKLVVMDENGNNKQVLDEGAPMFSPMWSPSGGKIIYFKGAPGRELYSVNRNQDGTWGDAYQVCPLDERYTYNNIYSTVFFDGEDYIMFDGDVPLGIYRVNLNTCELDKLESVSNEIQYAPDITDDGKMVFVKQEQNLLQNLYVKESFSTGTVEIITDTLQIPSMPMWSNNEQFICYLEGPSYDGARMKIYNAITNESITMNSTNSVRVLYEQQYHQRWSLDNKKLVFKGAFDNTNSTGEIYVLDIYNDRIINVSNSPIAVDANPVWQPIEPDGPDLVVFDAKASVNNNDEDLVKIFFKIKNIGNKEAQPSLTYVNAIDSNLPVPGNENQIRHQQSFTIPAIAPDSETIEFTAEISSEKYEQENIQYFNIYADVKNNVAETNEINNNLLQLRAN